MPRGDKSAFTEKQKRQARHIEEGYLERGVPEEEAEKRAWATVNAMTGGGKKSGSGRGKAVNKAPAKKGGRAALPQPGGPSVQNRLRQNVRPQILRVARAVPERLQGSSVPLPPHGGEFCPVGDDSQAWRELSA